MPVFRALTCLPLAPWAGLPASPLRGRITRPDVRVSLRTSPRPAPRPRASSSGGRTTSGGPATLAASPHLQLPAARPPASHHVSGRAEEAVPQSHSGRARAGAPWAAPQMDRQTASSPEPPPCPDPVPAERCAAARLCDPAPGLRSVLGPRLCSLTAASLLPLPTPSPCGPHHPSTRSPAPFSWHQCSLSPLSRLPDPGSLAVGPCTAALWLCTEGAVQVPGGAAGDYVKSPRCGDLAVRCAPLSWDVLAGAVFALEAAEVPALCACSRLYVPRPSQNPSFPGLPRLPAWENVVPSRSVHALTFPWRTPW